MLALSSGPKIVDEESESQLEGGKNHAGPKSSQRRSKQELQTSVLSSPLGQPIGHMDPNEADNPWKAYSEST